MLERISRELSPTISVSVVGRYHPYFKAEQYPPLDRPLTVEQWQAAVTTARHSGLPLVDVLVAMQPSCAVRSSERAGTRVRSAADKAAALRTLAKQIESCRRCRRDGIGRAVAGEGSADAEIILVGEAPGRHEAESGRPFVGRAGQWLRRAIQGIGLDENAVYLTSPIKYRLKRRRPTAADIAHGRVHLLQQIDIINPEIIVLLGSTACLAVLNEKIAVRARHGSVIERDGRMHLITCHPAASRFPAIGRAVRRDFRKLRTLATRLGSSPRGDS